MEKVKIAFSLLRNLTRNIIIRVFLEDRCLPTLLTYSTFCKCYQIRLVTNIRAINIYIISKNIIHCDLLK
jgi:hypothetical protein